MIYVIVRTWLGGIYHKYMKKHPRDLSMVTINPKVGIILVFVRICNTCMYLFLVRHSRLVHKYWEFINVL